MIRILLVVFWWCLNNDCNWLFKWKWFHSITQITLMVIDYWNHIDCNYLIRKYCSQWLQFIYGISMIEVIVDTLLIVITLWNNVDCTEIEMLSTACKWHVKIQTNMIDRWNNIDFNCWFKHFQTECKLQYVGLMHIVTLYAFTCICLIWKRKWSKMESKRAY